MGISKRELLEDYYPDEIGEIFHEYAELHKIDSDTDTDSETKEAGTKQAPAENFFGAFM